jgi:hypothetical protein
MGGAEHSLLAQIPKTVSLIHSMTDPSERKGDSAPKALYTLASKLRQDLVNLTATFVIT